MFRFKDFQLYKDTKEFIQFCEKILGQIPFRDNKA
jgi:hypothetical protein